MTFETDRRRAELGGDLRRLRIQAGLGQPQLAAALGWSQAKISKIENGRQQITPQDAAAWAEAVGAGDAPLLRRRAEETMRATTSWRELPYSSNQQRVGTHERGARLIRAYQPLLVPGLLQTPAYARRILEAGAGPDHPDAAQWLIARQERQEILNDLTRRFEWVIPEAAVSWRFGPAAEHLEQIDRLRATLERSNVRLGIIPAGQVTHVWRTHGFLLLERRTDDQQPVASVETLTDVLDVADPEDVERYQNAFVRLQEAAVHGDEARAVLDRVASDLAAMPDA